MYLSLDSFDGLLYHKGELKSSALLSYFLMNEKLCSFLISYFRFMKLVNWSKW